jgi:FKBP-type peptidyl-prolyl cis-trans isomerase SlyD
MEYTLRVDHEIVDSSQGQEPLEFLAGHQNIISGLERAMIGMKIGDSKDVVVPAVDGYGEYDQAAFLEVDRSEFPEDMPVEAGLELQVSDQSKQPRYARIESVAEDVVRLNFNHPLAGKELLFNVKVVGLRAATEEELDHGHAHESGHHH